MAKAKKALSLVLAAVMLMGVMSLISFAADAPAGQEATISFSYDKQSYAAGDTVTLTVKLTSNYFVAATAIPVEFDSAAAAYTGTGGVTGGALFGSIAATEIAAFPSEGLLYVALTPRAGQNAVVQQCTDVVLFTATFTAITAIGDPAKAFGVLDDQKTMSNLTGKLFVGSYATADITSTVYATGQTLTYPTLVVGGEPVLTGVDTGVVNTENMYVYGVPVGTAAEEIGNYFSVENGTLEISGNGTGATLTVKNAAGDVFETYTLIIFGDVNGDGTVTVADKTLVSISLLAGNTDNLTVTGANFAADVNGDGLVTVADKTAISLTLLGNTTAISVNPYA